MHAASSLADFYWRKLDKTGDFIFWNFYTDFEKRMIYQHYITIEMNLFSDFRIETYGF